MTAQVGIWLDKRNAHIVTLHDGHMNETTITSEVEEFHPKGGSGTPLKGGPQDVVQDSKYTARQTQQLKTYFNAIVKALPALDALVVFGPAQTRIHFAEELLQNHKDVAQKLVDVVKTDSMTTNQIKAWVAGFYG